MGEHKLSRANGRGAGARQAVAALVAAGKAPKPDVRLIATLSEVGAASYLVDFATFMGVSKFRSQMSAIAFVTKVPLRRLVGRVVEVCRVPDGTPIPERLVAPDAPLPVPNARTSRMVADAIAPQAPEPRSEAVTLPPEPEG